MATWSPESLHLVILPVFSPYFLCQHPQHGVSASHPNPSPRQITPSNTLSPFPVLSYRLSLVLCVRIKSKPLFLSTNNLSYARMRKLFGWWDLHPLPSSTTAPFSDSTK